MSSTVAAFYKFVTIIDRETLRQDLLAICRTNGVKGTILIAPEGINSTIAGTADGIAAVLQHLRSDARFADLTVKLSHASEPPFQRIKVKLKREIVTFGIPEADPNERVGVYVAPRDWNALLQDPETVLLDTRNTYEVAVGTFRGAIDPHTRAFHELPAFVEANLDPARHRKIAMFCTGGIRCEKASSYMLARGFEEVYHLDGGILAYLATVPEDQSLWNGECYVFDGRVAVEHGVQEGSHAMRRSCGHPMPKGETDSADNPCPMCSIEAA